MTRWLGADFGAGFAREVGGHGHGRDGSRWPQRPWPRSCSRSRKPGPRRCPAGQPERFFITGGRVLAWGADARGQLGIGGTGNRRTPVPVRLPAGSVPAAIGTGPMAAHSFAIVHN